MIIVNGVPIDEKAFEYMERCLKSDYYSIKKKHPWLKKFGKHVLMGLIACMLVIICSITF
jgi:hypothetical protein